MRVAAVVVAAGSGQRLGAELPKALVPLRGRPLYEWAATAMSGHPDITSVVLVVPRAAVSEVAAALASAPARRPCVPGLGRVPIRVVAGGDTRHQSVRLGLAAVDAVDARADVVLVHDAARPLVPAEVVSRVLAAVEGGADAVVPVVPLADTIKRVDDRGVVSDTVDRHPLRAVQTPQGFRRSVLVGAYQRHAEGGSQAGPEPTDDAGLVEAAGGSVLTVAGSELAFKITTAHDLLVADALAAGAVSAGAAAHSGCERVNG